MSARRRQRAAAIAALVAVACTPGPKDVAGEQRDVRLAPDERPAPAPAGDSYAHVARRAHGVVGLAEARHTSTESANAFVDRLADELDRCATGLEARGDLVEGAARVVAVAGPRGTAEGLNVRLAPGGAVAQNALLCVLAPLRALPFPPGDGSGPAAMALELTWGPGLHPAADGGGRLLHPAADGGGPGNAQPPRSGKLQPERGDAGSGEAAP